MGFAPDLTLTSLSTGLAIAGNGAVTVVNITGNVSLSSGQNITFSGGSSEYLVLNIFGDLDMGGNAAIGTAAQASHILLNLVTTGSLGNAAHVDNLINATTLIPYATYAEFHSINGAIYGGFGGDGPYVGGGTDGQIKLMSGSTLNYVPYEPPTPSVPDGGNTLALMGLGLASLGMLRLLLRSGNRVPAFSRIAAAKGCELR